MQIMNCGNYEETEKQMMRIKTAMKAVELALENIPLIEPIIEPTTIVTTLETKTQ
jgi:hypothetical protein